MNPTLPIVCTEKCGVFEKMFRLIRVLDGRTGQPVGFNTQWLVLNMCCCMYFGVFEPFREKIHLRCWQPGRSAVGSATETYKNIQNLNKASITTVFLTGAPICQVCVLVICIKRIEVG